MTSAYHDELARVTAKRTADGQRRIAYRLLRLAGRNATPEQLREVATAAGAEMWGRKADLDALVAQAIALQSEPAIVGRHLDPATTPVTPLPHKNPKVKEPVAYTPPTKRVKVEPVKVEKPKMTDDERAERQRDIWRRAAAKQNEKRKAERAKRKAERLARRAQSTVKLVKRTRKSQPAELRGVRA